MSERVFWMASGLLAACPNSASVNKSAGCAGHRFTITIPYGKARLNQYGFPYIPSHCHSNPTIPLPPFTIFVATNSAKSTSYPQILLAHSLRIQVEREGDSAMKSSHTRNVNRPFATFWLTYLSIGYRVLSL